MCEHVSMMSESILLVKNIAIRTYPLVLCSFYVTCIFIIEPIRLDT